MSKFITTVIFYVIWQKVFYIGLNMLEKHNGNMFEIFEALLVVLSFSSVKLHFTKSPLAAIFINFAQNQ